MSSSLTQTTDTKPWYKHPWPLFFAALPTIAVVAGLTTFWIAARTTDGLVAEDYYKEGLSIQEDINRLDLAKRLGIRGTLAVTSEQLVFKPDERAPVEDPQLLLSFVHPTRAGQDQTIVIARHGAVYSANMPSAILMGAWKFQLENAQKTWRIVGVAHLPETAPVVLEGMAKNKSN